MTLRQSEELNHTPGAERRSSLRFPVVTALEYSYRVTAGCTTTGRGVILNLSSNGVLFQAKESLSVGKPIRLAIVWPLHLAGQVQLNLIAAGHVVRTEGNQIAVKFSTHEFRTRRTTARPAFRPSTIFSSPSIKPLSKRKSATKVTRADSKK